MMKHAAVHLPFVCLGQYIWVHEQSVNPKKGGLDVMYVKSLTVQNAFQSIPNLISWSDWEMGTDISRTKCSQVVGLIHTTGRSSSNVVSLCAAVHTHAQSVCCSALVTKTFVHRTIATSFFTSLCTR